MNIKITKEEHQYLLEFEIERYVIGSKLYGTSDEYSDTDVLCIYEDLRLGPFLYNVYPNIHQFQYDDIENNTQYIWTTEEQFYKNLYSGDSTINVDILLFDNKFEDSLKHCRTYKVIKSFLGLAKRDLRDYKKGKNKLFHVQRGIYMVEKLLGNNLPELEDFKSMKDWVEKNKDDKDYRNFLRTEIERLRQEANELLDKGELKMYYIPKVENPLFQKLLDSNNTREFKY